MNDDTIRTSHIMSAASQAKQQLLNALAKYKTPHKAMTKKARMTTAKSTSTTSKKAKPIVATTMASKKEKPIVITNVSEGLPEELTGIISTDNVSNTIESKQCASIRSNEEPHLQCLMTAKNNKYCAIHLLQKHITDYDSIDNEMNDILDRDKRMFSNDKSDKSSTAPVETQNLITKKINLQEIDRTAKYSLRLHPERDPKSSTEKSVLKEQKVTTVINSHNENEDNLEIKLLILVNDDEYSKKIPELIGPVFDNIILSEDEHDPVTMDPIWTWINGVKIPAAVNKYYLFSYEDSKQKIRCITIFTLYDMLQSNDYKHPITMEEIPKEAIDRAKELIDIYSTKIGLFNQDETNLSAEFKLKNRITKLFKQFHIHSIYLEESWFTSITDENQLYKIITETEKLVSNNIKSINPDLHNFKIFQKKQIMKSKKKGKMSKMSNDEDDNLIMLQEYIVSEWEKLISAADNSQNQIPIWILVSGLSFVVPEIKQKYPNLEIMLG